MLSDHDIKVWVDGPTYLALKALAHADHRGLSDYIRHVLLVHLEHVSVAEARADRPQPLDPVSAGGVRSDRLQPLDPVSLAGARADRSAEGPVRGESGGGRPAGRG
jgi:hypothetical protein